MKVYPIAFDSLGVRSMSTIVVLNDIKIFIDPYAALAPIRYGLKPSHLEIEMLNFYLEQIYKLGSYCDYAIITHYHYDHHPIPEDNNFFKSFKKCHFLIKDFEKEHFSAKKRGSAFTNNLKKNKISFEFVDGKKIKIEDIKIKFSKPVWHGEVNSKVGRVIMVCIEYLNRKLFFGSDAQFLIDKNALKFALKIKPNYLIIDGFPTILEGYKVKHESFLEGIKNMKKIFERVNYSWIIIDHHLLRDKDFEKKFPFFDYKKIITAAKFYNLENLLLEAYRKEIYKKEIIFDLEVYKDNARKVISKIINSSI